MLDPGIVGVASELFRFKVLSWNWSVVYRKVHHLPFQGVTLRASPYQLLPVDSWGSVMS